MGFGTLGGSVVWGEKGVFRPRFWERKMISSTLEGTKEDRLNTQTRTQEIQAPPYREIGRT